MQKFYAGKIKIFIVFFGVLALSFFVFGKNFHSNISHVSADDYDRVNILPGEFEIQSNSEDIVWENVKEIFIHDLDSNSNLDQFHSNNSGYILLGFEKSEIKENDKALNTENKGGSEEKTENDNSENNDADEIDDNPDNNETGEDDNVDNNIYSNTDNDDEISENNTNSETDDDSNIEEDSNNEVDDGDSNIDDDIDIDDNEILDENIEDETNDKPEQENIVDLSQNNNTQNNDAQDDNTTTDNEKTEDVKIDEQNDINDNKTDESSSSNPEEDKQTNNSNIQKKSFINRLFGHFKTLVFYVINFEFFDSSSAMAQNLTNNLIIEDNDIKLNNDIPPIIEKLDFELKNNLVINNDDIIYEVEKLNFKSHSIIFSDFLAPADYEDKLITNVQLRLSLAALSNKLGDKILVEYSLDNDNWNNIGLIDIFEEKSNASNGGYFLFAMPIFESWDEIDEMKIKVTYETSDKKFENQQTKILFDALWLEIFSDDLSEDALVEESLTEQFEEERLNFLKLKKGFNLELLSEKNNFKVNEKPNFNFKFKKERNLLEGIGAAIKGIFKDEFADLEIKAQVKNRNSEELNKLLKVVHKGDGEIEVSFDFTDNIREFKPGKYEIELLIKAETTNGEFIDFSQDFSWGVLAINVNKSIYTSNNPSTNSGQETAYIQMGVLDNNGHTICNANLNLKITAPDGGVAILSSDNGLVISNPACGPDNVINVPDYYAHYDLAGVGEYIMELTAYTDNGIKKISDKFEVRSELEFDLERVGPTRIYPWADYDMRFNLLVNKDFEGLFSEYVPKSFKIKNNGILKKNKETGIFEELERNFKVTETETEKILTWFDLKWQVGDEFVISYSFDAPNISPEFFLLGPAKLLTCHSGANAIESQELRNITGTTGSYHSASAPFQDDSIVIEARQWQIASDAEVQNILYESIAVDGGTTDTTNWTTITTAPSTDFTASDKYLVYVTAGFAGSTSGVSTDFEIRYGSTVQYTGFIEAPAGTNNEAAQISWFDVYDQPASPTSIGIYYRTNSDTSYALNTQILAINLSDLDVGDWEYAENTTAVNHGTSLTQRANLTLNDADGTKDWLIFAMEEVEVNRTNVNMQGEIYDGSSSFMQYSREGEDTNELQSYVLYRPFDAVTSGTVFGIRVRDDSNGTNRHLMSRVFALNLDAFESHKTYYANINTSIGNGTWTEIGNLNQSGNYLPSTTGNQFIFTSFINDTGSATAGTDDRLQVNGVTTPTNWGWAQSPAVSKTSYDTTDEICNNVFSRISIPTTGYTIDLDAMEDATGRVADEISMTVFSTELVSAMSVSADEQYKSNYSIISNGLYSDNNNIILEASAPRQSSNEMNFYFEVIVSTSTFTSAITEPASSCAGGTTFATCSSSIWKITVNSASSTITGTSSITSIPDSSTGYKWQVIAFDGNSVGSTWDGFNVTTPNFLIDTDSPDTPGDLSLDSKTSGTIIVDLGAQTADDNFLDYKIFYKVGDSGVTESDTEQDNSNLDHINYNGANTVTVTGLNPETEYVINIWAYDEAGNSTKALNELTATTDIAPRAKTVQFPAGSFSGDGTTGQNSDTNQTFSSFDYSLIESDVEIKNAYIIYEAQFESYANNSGNYTGYNLAFDTCQKPCTVNAFAGSGNVVKDDNTVLAYDESESNRVRLLLDVTDEVQLAAYSGNGTTITAQVGYNIERGLAINSISFAQVILIITYTYDKDSVSITNTVVYPLESNISGDSGTMLNSQADDCTLDSNCPLFNYNMQIPELSDQLSHWFIVHGINDGNTGNDIYINLNIEGDDATTSSYVHEAVNAGTQGNTQQVVFSNVSGYTENTNQQLEYSAVNLSGASTHYVLGGEVFETYTASSSMAIKTRTASFPMGVIGNGLSAGTNYGSSEIYFPENGNSTGKVSVKKVWFRILNNNYNNGANTVTVNSKIGTNATSSNYVYDYNVGSTVINPTFRIIHVASTSEYAELELASAVTPKTVSISTVNSNSASQGGTSVELMITYTYSSEQEGYLNSLSLFAGQSDVNGNSQLATSVTPALVFPEAASTKTLLSAALLPSYLYSDSDATIASDYLIGTALATTTCTNSYNYRADSVNTFAEYYQDVSSSLSITNNQTYELCYSNNGGGDTSGGAKMNSQLIYTYQYYSPKEVSATANNQYKSDISTTIANGGWTDESTVYLTALGTDNGTSTEVDFYFEFLTSTSTFTSNTSVPTGACSSGTAYGNCSSGIWTVTVATTTSSVGTTSIVSIPDSVSGYKWQVLACNDDNECSYWDDFNIAPNIKVDTTSPEAPGNLTLATSSAASLTLTFGSSTTEINFDNYKIFYKAGVSGVSVSDLVHTDSNLNYINYYTATTTTITGLKSGTQYVINIWAYDEVGNKTSATELIVSTGAAPHARAKTIQFFAGKYSGNGTTGQNSDTEQTFSAFNFSLPEKDVSIRNAYIVFESRFEAYTNNAGDYTGYELAFDVCEEPCIADAFGASDNVVTIDNTVLAYDESATNKVRLLLDVSDEIQLSSYIGESTELEAQIGYKINRGTAVNSIANAMAILYVTYNYNGDDSESIINTVVYPLESSNSGDSGTRQSVQTDDCTLDSDCPLFSYNFVNPESSDLVNQWFNIYAINDSHGAEDVDFNVNIESANVDSDIYTLEAVNGNEQGNIQGMFFDNVFGFTENASDSLEIRGSSAGAADYYLLGGEIFGTYLASSSASIKTRTISFSVGVVSNGNDVSSASGTAQVYFPENGGGSGIVDIKKAWFRIKGSDYNNSAYTITVSSKAGDNTQSSNYIYNMNVGGRVINPMFNIIHVIPESDYSELELANKSSAKDLVVYTINSSTNLGGVSAELMITYTYSSEASGYLTGINIIGGQDANNANAQNSTSSVITIFPELRGTKTVLSSALLSSYLINDSDASVPATWFSLGSNLATSNPSCSNNFNFRPDSINGFSDFYNKISSSLSSVDSVQYEICVSNTNSSDTSAGAKMNSQLFYTYKWDAPSAEFTQDDWRWFDNADSVQPGSAKVATNTIVTNVDIGNVLRLRMNVAISTVDLATSTQSFKLQYAKKSNCLTATTSDWSDVGGISGSESWIGYNNPDPVDGANITSSLLGTSDILQTYEESNPTLSNPRAIDIGYYGEWDFVLYNNDASSSADYCFRIVKSDGTSLEDYLTDSYPKLTTNKSNTEPSDAYNLGQFHDDEITTIPNTTWINENDIKLTAAATDSNLNEIITLYFELIPNASSSITATSTPVGACVYGTAYNSCDSKVWFVAPGVAGDYRVTPYIGTTSIISIPENSDGYKWQVLACDDDGDCSTWKQSGSTPNFKIDTTDPEKPGSLIFSSASSTNITLDFGATTTEDNFLEYKIFYKALTSGVTELDSNHDDANLGFIDYGTSSDTTIINLSANTVYYFNIWAYDEAGNKASSSSETVATTTSSFTPPTGSIAIASQETKGNGIINIAILVDDNDNDDTLRAKLVYTDASCNFSTSSDPVFDETDSNITATHGDPDIDNDSEYQVGTSTAWIITSPGSNYVFFDWETKVDLPNANGDYCLGLVVNDGLHSQIATDTKIVLVDNIAPNPPGALSSDSKDFDSVTLKFGGESSDMRFDEYRIFYKIGTSSVDEADTEHSDSNLSSVNYSGATTTTVSGLEANTDYVFNIWAYDNRGNKASSSEVTVKTNAVPINISADNQLKSDGLTNIPNQAWTDDDGITLSSSVHDQDSGDTITFYYEVIETADTFTASNNVPSNPCPNAMSYTVCTSTIWSIATTSSGIDDDWYDNDWLYRKKISINSNQVIANENDFTVLIDITDSNLLAKARSDAYDILFTDSSGTSTLNYEREFYDSVTGKLTAWVNVSISSSTDTEIYLYYGNEQNETDMAAGSTAWDSNYVGIWHLEETVIDESSEVGVHYDSMINSGDGDQYGNNEVTTQIYRGQEFDGIDDYIDIGNTSNSINTVSFWIKTNSLTEDVLDFDGDTHTIKINAGVLEAGGFASPTIYIDGIATTSIDTNWHYVSVVTATSFSASAVQIAKISTNYFDGLIDELNFSDASRSSTWIKTSYNNQYNTGFISLDNEEQVTSFYETSLITSVPNSSTGYKWQVLACDSDGDCSPWQIFDSLTPNFKVDISPPSAPGILLESSKTSSNIVLTFGSETIESNFATYKMFYATSSSVDENSIEHIDSNLGSINYGGETITNIVALLSDTQYYFNIWAYDEVGNKASSTEVMYATNPAVSSPGVAFYTKNERTLYYQVWDGNNWESEQSGPTLGTAAGDNIRHIRSVRSDDGGKIGVLVKTWDGVNQEWWGTVYNFVADTFATSTQLGSSLSSVNNAQLMTACIASLSDNEFVVVGNNGIADGSLVYSWNVTDDWTSEGAGPDPVAVLAGCKMVRRSGTDNYLLITHDDDNHVGSAYYYGGSTYGNSWTTWTEHATLEEDADNFAPDAYFDESSNTRGAISFSNSNTAWNTQAKFFICDNTSINYGSANSSSNEWTDDFIDGEFFINPGGTGDAYFVGRDIDQRLSVLKMDISTNQTVWATSTNASNIAGTNLYNETTDSQKPYAITFYKDDKGVVAYNDVSNNFPYYRIIDASSNSLDSSSTQIPGADSNIWTRMRIINDPNEDEFITILQNDDVDYSAVFWNGVDEKFYNSTDHSGSNQVWTELATTSGAFDQDDENISFSFSNYNAAPNSPSSLIQYKTDATTAIANLGWTDESTVKFSADLTDPDTEESISVYLELILNTDTYTSSTTEPTNACTASTIYESCSSKIWLTATSSLGDYSSIPFTSVATINSISSSTIGYKWRIMACDDESKCSSWIAFNASGPNFKVDVTAPAIPGDLTVTAKDSSSITLDFGAESSDTNFSNYKIFYSTSTPATINDIEHNDSDLNTANYGGTSNTIVSGLASSTLYYLNI